MKPYDWSQFHVRMYSLAPDGSPRAANERVGAGDRYHWTYVHDFGHGGTFEEVAPGSTSTAAAAGSIS